MVLISHFYHDAKINQLVTVLTATKKKTKKEKNKGGSGGAPSVADGSAVESQSEPIRRHPRQPCVHGHGPCNVPVAAMEQVENYVVSNARIVQNDSQLWDMCNHLSSTVLQYNENFQGDLFKLLTLGMPDRYKAQYCIAKANRFILVKCLACGCGMYGKYGYKDPEDQKETIRVLAAFVNRKLEASAAHL